MENDISKLVSGKLSSGDIKGAVRILSSDDTILPFSSETLTKFAAKHPEQPLDLTLPAGPSDADKSFCYSVEREEVRKCISRFNPGSGGGHDSLLPQHLKDITAESLGMVANDLLDSLCRFFNEIILPGSVPVNICPAFYGARLFALSKKDGGVRPIAVGCTLRRIVAKLCMFKVKTECKSRFLPQQLGVGIPSGAEACIHSCRKFIKRKHNSPKVFLKVDFRNAFNSLRRDSMLNLIKSNFPGMFPLVWQSYSTDANLYFGSDTLLSSTGIQQGDALGPFLFAVGIQALTCKMKSEFNSWYLDDGSLGGDPEVVLQDYQMIISEGIKLGLELNPGKCELYPINLHNRTLVSVVSTFQKTTPEIKLVDSKELTLLGSPILAESYNTTMDVKKSRIRKNVDPYSKH